MDTHTSPKPASGNGNKIPLRLLVLATVAVLVGLVVGGLTWLSSPPAFAVLAGLAAFGGTFKWLVEHVD